uniref:BED-type domain-containing protein n=1 Tax=Phytophthora ramorum TaxID=164328 RepID=H3GFM1_PHYRM
MDYDGMTANQRELSPGKWKCNSCRKVYKEGRGYTNQVHLLLRMHPDYPQLAEAAFQRMPASFCERPLVYKNAKMDPIAATTLKKYINLLYGYVRDVIAVKLPDLFGIALDGWLSGGRHFVAIMAVYNETSTANDGQRNPSYDDSIQCLSRRFVLLAICPFAEEVDLGAQSLYDLIADTLATFNKPWSSVLFMIGDNCSVNQSIGRKAGALPFIGCASHRFQPAVNDFLGDEESLLAKIHALMKHLSTIKGRSALRKVTPLAPVMRNATRWSSTFAILERYVKPHPVLLALDHATVTKHGMAKILLTDEAATHAHEMLKKLGELNEVTKALQDSTLTLVGACRSFDLVARKYPRMKARLASDAPVVNYPDLETGIVKIILGSRLSAREQAACASFKCSGGDVIPAEESRSFMASVFKKTSKSRTAVYMALE